MRPTSDIPTIDGFKIIGLGAILPVVFVFHGVEVWIAGEGSYSVFKGAAKLYLRGVALNAHVIELIAGAAFMHAKVVWGYFFPESRLLRLLVRAFGMVALVAIVVLLLDIEPHVIPS